MASEVDICNLALSLVGDKANVQSIIPTDGSMQSALCARFYGQTRDEVLQSHAWSFATVRAELALLDSVAPSPWTYVHARPSNALRIFAVLAEGEADDRATQPFAMETLDGTQVIYSNILTGVVRYVRSVTDTALFSPMVTSAIAYGLAAKLAGPITKDTDRTVAMLKAYTAVLAQAKGLDADQSKSHVWRDYDAGWIRDR